MAPTTLDGEPACPGTADFEATASLPPDGARLRAVQRPFDEIPRGIWDALAGCNPWATPFSAWAFHRAWWDAYGDNAHEETLVVVPAEAPADALPVAIVPLMHRHAVESSDALTHTRMRHGVEHDLIAIQPSAKVTFFGASYHADYATVLTPVADMPAVAAAVATYLATTASGSWDAVDLRRLRCADPVAGALAGAIGAMEVANGWTMTLEREDVCPVVTLPVGVGIEDVLATLGKKARHEIRRKVRRAEAVGPVRLVDSTNPLEDLPAFIDMHQRRWGVDGLFPPTPGGDQSRVFARRLFESFGPDGALRLTFLTVGGRRIAAGIHLETADSYLYYNAGVDPDAFALSPGVLMIHAYVAHALATGKGRLDLLRGNEPYKYDWGAVDEPIQRLLVRRNT